MKKYVGTKMIEAKQMNRGAYNDYRGWKIPLDEDPADEGYLVKYSDGYESWSPKKQFEKAYRECENLTFGLAIELLKKGKKVTRCGWNGKGMYLFKSPKLGCQMYKEYTGEEINDLQEFIVMKCANRTLVPWLASQTDVLAEDWKIIDQEVIQYLPTVGKTVYDIRKGVFLLQFYIATLPEGEPNTLLDRKSTRLNSSHT